MKYVFFIFCVLGLSAKLHGQKSISGRVTNEENVPLEYATVLLKAVNDSSVVSFATTNDKGIYQLDVEREGLFFLQASYVGYKSQKKTLKTDGPKHVVFNFILVEDAIGLQELMVKGRKTGIQFGRDTVRYDVSHFKDGSEVVLGDVLNKLPGVTVDDKGGIKAYGKTVDKVLLNGQDFFQGNTQMASKNLSADLAENVEILNNYSEYSMLAGFQSHEQTVINVGVNKNKLGKISGNLSGGGGIKDRYEFKGNILQLKSKLMTSLIGSINNNGEEVFNIEDYIKLQGGVHDFLDSRGSGSSIKLSQEEQQLLTPKNNVYKRINGLGGANVAYQPNSSLKVNSYLLYNQRKETTNEQTGYTYFFPESEPFSYTKSSSGDSRHRMFSGSLRVDYQASPTLNFAYRGIFSNVNIENEEEAADYVQGKYVSSVGETDARLFKTRHNLSMLKLTGKHLLSASLSFSYNNNPLDYNLVADSLLLPLPPNAGASYFDALQEVKQRQRSGDAGVSFLYKINEAYYLRTRLGASTSTQKYYSDIYRENSTSTEYLNDYSLTMNDYRATIGIVKNRGMFQFKLGATLHYYDFETCRIAYKPNENRSVRITPNAEIALHFSPKHVLSLSAEQTEEMNDGSAFIDKLVIDSYQSYTKDSRVKSICQTVYQTGLNYRLFDLYSNTMLVIAGNYFKTRHPIATDYRQSGLVTEKSPVPVSPLENLMLRLYLNKGLGFVPWAIKLNIGHNRTSVHNKISGVENKARINNTTGQVQLYSNYHKVVDFEVQVALDIKNNHLLTGSRKQTIQRYAGTLKLNFHRRIWANAGIEHVINHSSDLKQRLYYLNADMYYALFKHIELNLSGKNMLHLTRQDWTSISYNDNYIAEKYFYQIPGHVILRIKYIF